AIGVLLELLQININRIGDGADGKFAFVAVNYRAARGDDLDLLPLIERSALRVMAMSRHLQPRQTSQNHKHPNAKRRAYPKRAAAGVSRLFDLPARRLSSLTLSGSFHFHGSRSVDSVIVVSLSSPH